MKRSLFIILLGLVSAMVFADTSRVQAEPQDSILTIRQSGPGRLTKAGGNAGAYEEQVRSSGRELESIEYRGFTILLNGLSDGSYEVQAFRIVAYGNHRVNSIFSSLYKSSVEFSYQYDKAHKNILQSHFLYPPNSLTGWANPGDYTIIQNFDWNEAFPSRSCYTDSPVNTMEESGREYLEAACLPDRDTALRFAQRFIDYMRSGRGL
jgi:hypothetical protein